MERHRINAVAVTAAWFLRTASGSGVDEGRIRCEIHLCDFFSERRAAASPRGAGLEAASSTPSQNTRVPEAKLGKEVKLAGRQGLEPRYADPESAVLPLDDLPEVPILASGGGVPDSSGLTGTPLESVLSLPGCDAQLVLVHSGTAQILEQQDHLVLLILKRACRAATPNCREGIMPVALELFDGFRQLRAAATASPTAFENARAQELSYILQFVCSQTLQKAPRLAPLQVVYARTKRTHQGRLLRGSRHKQTPVPYE